AQVIPTKFKALSAARICLAAIQKFEFPQLPSVERAGPMRCRTSIFIGLFFFMRQERKDMNYSREHTTLNERILLARLDEQAPASTDTLRIPAGSTWIHLQSTADKLRNCGLGEQSIYQGLRDFLAEYSILHFIKRHGPLT